MSLTCKIITPPSQADSNLEQYEYMLVWQGRKGELLQWLFYDFEIQYRTDVENINLTDSTTIGNLVVSERDEVVLFAENLNRNELDTLRSILVSKSVYRVAKDGTAEKLSVTGKQANYKNSAQRFNFEFSVIQAERNLPQ